MAEVLEVYMHEGLCEYIQCVVFGPNALDCDVACQDKFLHVVVLDPNVFGVRVPNMIFGEAGCHIVVTVQMGRPRGKEA